jgi:hypothetical protein
MEVNNSFKFKKSSKVGKFEKRSFVNIRVENRSFDLFHFSRKIIYLFKPNKLIKVYALCFEILILAGESILKWREQFLDIR